MKKCDCRHCGNCPFDPGPGPAVIDLAGEPLFRPLTPGEQTAQGNRSARSTDPSEPAHVVAADFVGTDGQGSMAVLGKPLDPDKAVRYVQSKLGRRCRAEGFMWRKGHPFLSDLASDKWHEIWGPTRDETGKIILDSIAVIAPAVLEN